MTVSLFLSFSDLRRRAMSILSELGSQNRKRYNRINEGGMLVSSSWKLFFIVESLLALLGLYQLIQNPPQLLFLIFGLVNISIASKKMPRNSFHRFQLLIGLLMTMLALLTIGPAIWLMMIFAIVFIGLKGVEVTGLSMQNAFDRSPWQRKEMKIVKTVEPEDKNGRRFKRPWIGNQRIGTEVYEWDDINITLFSGDTIIDLGNTLLPKADNVVMIRKALGRTRVLVPIEIGLMIEHSTLYGNVIFDEQTYTLKNESLKLFSDDYDHSTRRLKIVTSTLVGDIEVIRI